MNQRQETHRGWLLTAIFITNHIDAGWWEWRAYDPNGGWHAGTSLTQGEALATARLWVDTQLAQEAA